MFWDSSELKDTIQEIRKDVKEVLVTVSALIQQVKGLDETNKVWHGEQTKRCNGIESRVRNIENELKNVFAEADRIKGAIQVKESFFKGIWQAIITMVALIASILAIALNVIRRH